MSPGTYSINISHSHRLSVPVSTSFPSCFFSFCMHSPLGRQPVRLGADIDCHVKTALKLVTTLALREQGLCERYYMFFSVQNDQPPLSLSLIGLQCRISSFVIHIQRPTNFNNNNNKIASGVYLFITFTEFIFRIYIFWVGASL